ncbi:MAG: C39 family peptidase, partial [Steroidobacteraceae bacterium]|nr:C39 family peptidase [Steroidobacteraceae bacterium]MDW8259654.1 C39 family peptidase [Gammaproteobacteria bacterium]
MLRTVLDLYERGLTLSALRHAQTFCPLQRWSGRQACIVAARIAAQAGAPALGLRLSTRAWRENPRSADALFQYAFEILGRRGPLAVWQLLRRWQSQSDEPPRHVAELLALKARAASELRDFRTAEALLNAAQSMAPDNPWVRLQRAYWLEAQDLVVEALEEARAACSLHRAGHFRAGIQTCASLLQSLDRDDEAIELLQAKVAILENASIAVQLYGLLSENGRWPEAQTALERYVQLSPLLEPRGKQWVDAARARVAYHLGQRSAAVRFASEVNDDFHRGFVERLQAPPSEQERICYDVTFVRQHFKTCAPATLASLGRFFGMPAEHLQLAETICYDGTPTWQQRIWAEQNGWYVREFCVTYASAIALLERGVPFAISVVYATSAHMMAVIGVDRTRRTLLLRDPSQPYALEPAVDDFFERHRAFGPHGIVYVPAPRRSLLDGLELPAAALYDDYHALQVALAKHDHANAVAALERMTRDAADDPLTWHARCELAAYEANPNEQARCLDRLLNMFEGDPALLLRRFALLAQAPREERVGFLASACDAKSADPALLVTLAQVLRDDARAVPHARRLLRRALRVRPLDAEALRTLADLAWQEGAVDEATEYYRFAANLETFREDLYRHWFLACRQTGQTAEALQHLEDRFERFGARSEYPALTLAWAWKEMEQPLKAREIFAIAMRQRPGSGLLPLRAAVLCAELGQFADADTLLAEARGKVRDSDWLRGRLEIAEARCAYAEVITLAEQLLAQEPLALDLHSQRARALARIEGNRAALESLQRACREFPHHYGLQRMRIEWSWTAGPAAVENAARDLLAIEPADAWARRELAV